ncbi:AMP-binding protein [Caldalkalibacillus salinus]|uniref:AMP-binding protein n=1 Tax=Caldalkalibacillus salinus TaxID=2803787 RepID=UPI001921EBD6|nr:AMP-binding protein [Caldalkalibacillus salinus]
MANRIPWSEHYPPQIQPHYDYPNVSLPTFLKEATKKYPQHIALQFLGKTLTYQELYDLSCQFSNALTLNGVKKGDRVAIMLPNCPQAVIGYYGALMAGAIVVQTNPLYTERELEYQLNDAGAKVLLSLDIIYKRIEKIMHQTPLEKVVITSLKDYLPFPKNLLYPLKAKKDGLQTHVPQHDRVERWRTFLVGQAGQSEPQVHIHPREDLALLQYTGGTTGKPKGVMLTHYNLVVNAFQSRQWLHRSKEGKEKLLAALPFFHVYGMSIVMNLSIYMGGTLLLIPKFDTDLILKTIQDERPTIFPGAPTMYIAIINHPNIERYDLSSIHSCISGSAPLPVEVQEKFEQLTKGRLVEGYGLTESSPVTHANMIWGKRKIGSIGVPWPDTEAKIVNLSTGETLPPGEVGELVVKGPQVMKGYWKRVVETDKVLRDGWLYTGDIAKMDEEGFFYIMDRKKDMIIAGGFNIYPREIEEILFEHPKVMEASVIGIPDQYRGETVKAYIVAKEGQTLTVEELDQFSRRHLASYKVPHIYEFREELPKSIIGKVLRRELIEEEKKKRQQEESKTNNDDTNEQVV